ncbi:hypothetical protein ccbrp13_49790 [Ktedonobacteria bacterium brp13]|nr:hypothetical protein ccbrp13_49790 [Ktedonobacteria bacterium brp13]
MPSYSRSRRRHASRGKMIQYRKKSQSTPYAPPELDAMLGYGTSYSFPLFMAGIVSLVKRLFGGKKHKK